MKYVALILIYILSVSAGYVGGQREVIQKFADSLRIMVANSDEIGFKKLSCIPDRNKDCARNPDLLNRIFAGEKDSNFEKIIRMPGLNIKILGPLTIEDKWLEKSYIVFFYDESLSPFGQNGRISDEVGQRELFKSFLQTIVTIVNGKAYFHRTPFYMYRHHPYVGDYG